MLVLSVFHNWVLRKRKNKGGLSEVPWLTVGLVVGHQSIRTRVLVISRLVLLTPGLLVPELQTQRLDVLFTAAPSLSSSTLPPIKKETETLLTAGHKNTNK